MCIYSAFLSLCEITQCRRPLKSNRRFLFNFPAVIMRISSPCANSERRQVIRTVNGRHARERILFFFSCFFRLFMQVTSRPETCDINSFITIGVYVRVCVIMCACLHGFIVRFKGFAYPRVGVFVCVRLPLPVRA